MCLSPVTIRNRTKTYIPGVTPEFIQVPCNKCHECTRLQQNSWALRCSREIQKFSEIGGCSIFLTLTYSPKCLPLYLPNEGLVHGEYSFKNAIPVFDKSDIDTFLDSFRKHLSRFYGVSGVKYIICCEYGQDRRFSRRGHYHTIIHIPETFDAKFLIDLVEKFWHYGKVLVSPQYGLFCRTNFGAKYVSKYMTKDLTYFQNPLVHNYLFSESGEIIRDHYDKIKPYLAKHWQSQGYGSDLVDDVLSFDYDEIKNIFVKGLRNAEESLRQGKEVRNPLPLYVYNKLVYKYHPNGTRTLSDFGQMILHDTFRVKLDNKVKQFYDLVSYENLKNLSLHDIKTLSEKFLLPVHTHFELSNYLNSNIIPIILYLYQETVPNRDLSTILSHSFSFNSVDSFIESLIKLKLHQLDILSLYSRESSFVDHESDHSGYFTTNHLLVNRYPQLEEFISFYPQLLQDIHSMIQTNIHIRRLEEENNIKYLKNCFAYV